MYVSCYYTISKNYETERRKETYDSWDEVENYETTHLQLWIMKDKMNEPFYMCLKIETDET